MYRAILIMLVSVSLIPLGDSASKVLTNVYSAQPAFVAWARFLVGAMAILIFMRPHHWRVFRLPIAWARGFVLALGITSITFALQHEGLGTVFGTFFIAPIVSFVLSAIFLKEPVTVLRSALLGVGFVGVLFIAKPGFGFSIGVGYALLAGCSFGTFLTLSRAATAVADPVALLFSQLAIATVLVLPLGAPNLPTFSGPVVGLLILSGLASMLGNLGIIFAHKFAQATKLAPFIYFQLFAALGLGWLIFSDLPDGWSLFGMMLIIFSGVGSSLLKR